MIVRYLLSSTKGDVPVSDEELSRPLHLTLAKTHPFLALRDYFDSVRAFLLEEDGALLARPVSRACGRDIPPDSVSQIDIRLEKVGTLYHVAGVAILSGPGSFQFAVSTAFTNEARVCIEQEAGHIRLLREVYHLDCLPEICFKGNNTHKTPQGEEVFSHAIQEWLEDYHEWHLTEDEGEAGNKLLIWDMRRGYRLATPGEQYEIFRQASKILTLCYDPITYRQVYPWHHAAGDFIVRTEGGVVDVKLTTVRGYQPIPVLLQGEEVNPWTALVLFFLNLTIKMRIDRSAGVGKALWAQDPCLAPVVEGFLDGLGAKESNMGFPLGKVDDLVSLLKGFSREELERLAHLLIDFYGRNERGDLPVIQAHLKDHIAGLHRVIQSFP